MPRTVTWLENSRTLRATLAAPPGEEDSLVTLTTGTGASGEMRETLPQMNSSSIKSPTTSTRWAGKAAIRPRSGAAWESTGIGEVHWAAGCAGLEHAAGGRGRGGFARDHDQRERRPGHEAIQAAPHPDGLIKDFEHRFINSAGAQQLAVGEPGRRAGFIEAE